MEDFLQPESLESVDFQLVPLKSSDWEELYLAASDPKIWEQHPQKDRWKRNVFRVFFDEAIESKGAFVIIDKENTKIIGSTRFYNYDEKERSIVVGYTFFRTEYWGTEANKIIKNLMLNYIFQYVDIVKFYVGPENYRSQKALEKLGAKKIAKSKSSQPGSFEFQIKREEWALLF